MKKETLTVDKKKFENALDYLAHGKHEFIGCPLSRDKHMARIEKLKKRLGVIDEN